MSAFEYVANCWYPIGFSREFKPGELQGHKVANKPIVMWRTQEGEVVAFDDRCCHKRFPLSESKLLESGVVECAYHGLCYDATGQCVAIPSHPDGPIPPQAKLRVVPVQEQDGVVWVWPGDPAKAGSVHPPRTPEVNDESRVAVGSPDPLHVPANYLLLIENLLDITHFYPLHDGNIGDKENSAIPIQLEEGVDGGYSYVKTIRETENYRQPPYLREWFLYDEVDRVHTHCMVSPGLTRVEMRVAPPGQLGTDAERGYVLLHLHMPVDAGNLVWRWNVSCRKGHTPLNDPATPTAYKVAEMFPEVVAQDQWALERQQKMFAYPDDGYSELFLKPDKALRRARQILMAMQRQERSPEPETIRTVQA
ncbi:Rieske 2Fe-2S domain-containing protein [Halomonas kalidii]|uniref:Rieske 2Fe-2S domain-containing protein n=1 Tax=Halomonas kalidii TaxID=3043293 RepID=A0ABT6VII2_9GAMM|nr:Rieske 2Fe-2S domain-containing protein [Halomonas kalidii]MDI5933791.1 Rieske 2Fe-2S domain-containing protein [Halomonas kalidii]